MVDSTKLKNALEVSRGFVKKILEDTNVDGALVFLHCDKEETHLFLHQGLNTVSMGQVIDCAITSLGLDPKPFIDSISVLLEAQFVAPLKGFPSGNCGEA